MDKRDRFILKKFFNKLVDHGLNIEFEPFGMLFDETVKKYNCEEDKASFIPEEKAIYISKEDYPGHPFLVKTYMKVYDNMTGEEFITYNKVKPSYNGSLNDPSIFKFRKDGRAEYLPINSFSTCFDEIKQREVIDNLIPEVE